MLRAAFPPELIDQALDHLRRARLVDDAAFASYWLEQRQTFRPRGERLLRAELRQRGIAADVAAETAASTVPGAADDAYRAAQRRAHQLPPTNEQAFRTKLTALLARRGFDWDTITTTVERLYREELTSRP